MKLFAFLLTLTLTACGSSGSSNSSPTPIEEAPSDGSVRGWKNTMTFYVSDRVHNDAVSEGLQKVLLAWNDLLGAPIFVYGGITSSSSPASLYSSLGDEKSVVMALEDWKSQTTDKGVSKDSRTIATSVWTTDASGYITEADILLNTDTYDFVDIAAKSPLSSSEEDTSVSAESLLLHEVGHCTGMQHRDQKSHYLNDTSSASVPQIMNPYLPIGSGSVRTEFTQGDKDQLLDIYKDKTPSSAVSLYDEMPSIDEDLSSGHQAHSHHHIDD